MAVNQVTDIQELIDRHNQLAVDEAETMSALIQSHPFETLVGVYPTTPDMVAKSTCEGCGEPELQVQDSLSLRPTIMCRHCINGMRRFSLRHKRAITEVCVDCGGNPRMDSYGLVIGPWPHMMMAIEDYIGADDTTKSGLRTRIAAGLVMLDDVTNAVTINP